VKNTIILKIEMKFSGGLRFMKKRMWLIITICFAVSIIISGITNINAADSKYKICPNGHKNPATAKYCVFCGLSLGDTRQTDKDPQFIKPSEKSEVQTKKEYFAICPKCGKKYADNKIKFCTVCGTNLSQTSETDNTSVSKKIEENHEHQSETFKTEEPKSAEESKAKTSTPAFDQKKYDVLLKNGEQAYMEKYYRIALQYFKEAIIINENGEDALYNAGVISYYMKNYSDAHEYFMKLISINNKDADSLIFNGLSLYKLGLKEEAKDNFKRVLLVSEKNSEHYKKAVEFFQKLK